MNLDPLRALSVLAETGSLAATASQLNLTPAAIHKQLKQIEYELGVRLYEKAGRGIKLTAAANVLLPYAKSAAAQVEAGRLAIEEWRGLRRGMVRVGSGPTLSSHWLPELLRRFRARFPQVQLTVETGSSDELLANTRQGRLDLALLVAPLKRIEPGFEVLTRWRFDLSLVTGDPGISDRPLLPELAKASFIGFRRGSRLDEMTVQFFNRTRLEPNTIMRFDNADAIRAVLRAGIGYSLLPGWTLNEDLASGSLRLIQIRAKPPAAWVEMVRHESSPLAPAAREFISMAKTLSLG
jgi:DNA-binding transcriptional LysR family regulator